MTSIIDLLQTNFVPNTFEHILSTGLGGDDEEGWDYILPLAALRDFSPFSSALCLPFPQEDAVRLLEDTFDRDSVVYIPLRENTFAVDEERLREIIGGKRLLWVTLYDAMPHLGTEILDEVRDDMGAFVIADARRASPPVISHFADYVDAVIVGMWPGFLLTRNYYFAKRNSAGLPVTPDDEWKRILSAAALFYTRQPHYLDEIREIYLRLEGKILVPEDYSWHNGVFIYAEGLSAEDMATALASKGITCLRFPKPSFECFDSLVFDESDEEEEPSLVLKFKEDTTAKQFSESGVCIPGQQLSGNVDTIVAVIEEILNAG